MERSRIAPLQKVTMARMEVKNNEAEPSCCGGAPTSNADACCLLDEEKKAEGDLGCGCGTAALAVSLFLPTQAPPTKQKKIAAK